jgi:hypothetical protein
VGPVFRILGDNNSRGFPGRRAGGGSRFGSRPPRPSSTQDTTTRKQIARDLIERLKNL